MSISIRRPALGLLAAASLLAIGAAPASAGVLTASTGDCGSQSLSRPFVPWLDFANYTPLPGGDFESGAQGWSLADGAAVTAGGRNGSAALSLRSGASATSPPICVGLGHPTIRFFTKRDSGWLLSGGVRVEVLYTAGDGAPQSLSVGIVSGTSSWQPTLPVPILVNALALDGVTEVAFRYTAVGSADWSMDDVWVDPWARK